MTAEDQILDAGEELLEVPDDGNPYVGPRAFREGQAKIFRGRDREASELLSFVISEPLVLFYAQSGAGKTSLLQARLTPDLGERGLRVLPIGRVGGQPPKGLENIENVYVYNLLSKMDGRRQRPESLVNLTIGDFLAQDRFQAAEDQIGRVLIIDQFEEIFTTNVRQWQHRRSFFSQLARAIQADNRLWVVLALREEYVAALDPFADLLPGRLRARYYMQLLDISAAEEAIIVPAAEYGRPFTSKASGKLLMDLCRLPAREDAGPGYAEFVAPLHLQVVCYQLWKKLDAWQPRKITEADLKKAGLNVDRALGNFYVDEVCQVSRELRQKVASYRQAIEVERSASKRNAPAESRPMSAAELDAWIAEQTETADKLERQGSERYLRWWCENKLITEDRTRASVHRGSSETAELSNKAVGSLAGRRLIRPELRAGGHSYELIHDRFIRPILQRNAVWRERYPIVKDVEAWDADRTRKDLFYEGGKLRKANQKARDGDATSVYQDVLVQEFLEASGRAQSRRRLRFFGILGAMALFGLAALLVTFLLVLPGRQAAAREMIRAEETTNLRARWLAALADDALQEETGSYNAARALLLAYAAYGTKEITDTERALVKALQAPTKVDIAGGNAITVTSVATTRDGRWVVAGDSVGRVSIWTHAFGSQRYRVNNGPSGEASPVVAVDVSEDGRWVAAGDIAGNMSIWQLPCPICGPQRRASTNLGEPLADLALSREGDRLAVVGDSGAIWLHGSRDWEERVTIASNGRVNDVAISDNNRWLAAAGDGLHLYYLVGTQRYPQQPEMGGDEFSQVAFSPAGGRVAAATAGGLVKLWRLNKLDDLPLQYHWREPLFDLGFNHQGDGLLVLLASEGRIVTAPPGNVGSTGEICLTAGGRAQMGILTADGRSAAIVENGTIELTIGLNPPLAPPCAEDSEDIEFPNSSQLTSAARGEARRNFTQPEWFVFDSWQLVKENVEPEAEEQGGRPVCFKNHPISEAEQWSSILDPAVIDASVLCFVDLPPHPSVLETMIADVEAGEFKSQLVQPILDRLKRMPADESAGQLAMLQALVEVANDLALSAHGDAATAALSSARSVSENLPQYDFRQLLGTRNEGQVVKLMVGSVQSRLGQLPAEHSALERFRDLRSDAYGRPLIVLAEAVRLAGQIDDVKLNIELCQMAVQEPLFASTVASACTEAIDQAIERDDATLLLDVCLGGTKAGLTAEVQPACSRAVTLAQESADPALGRYICRSAAQEPLLSDAVEGACSAAALLVAEESEPAVPFDICQVGIAAGKPLAVELACRRALDLTLESDDLALSYNYCEHVAGVGAFAGKGFGQVCQHAGELAQDQGDDRTRVALCLLKENAYLAQAVQPICESLTDVQQTNPQILLDLCGQMANETLSEVPAQACQSVADAAVESHDSGLIVDLCILAMDDGQDRAAASACSSAVERSTDDQFVSLDLCWFNVDIGFSVEEFPEGETLFRLLEPACSAVMDDALVSGFEFEVLDICDNLVDVPVASELVARCEEFWMVAGAGGGDEFSRLEYGVPAGGYLEPGQLHTWQFSGRAGQVIQIAMESPDGSLDTTVSLRDEHGLELEYNDDAGGTFDSLIEEFVLPYDGIYYVTAGGYDESSGEYRLLVTPLAARLGP